MTYSKLNRLLLKVSTCRTNFPLLATTLLTALTITGCASSSGNLAVSPASLNFGSVAIGSSSNQSLTLTNSGTAAMTIIRTIASGGGFTLEGPPLPLTLAGGQSATFTTIFAPTAIGSVSGNLSITRSQLTSPQASTASVPIAPIVTTQIATITLTGAGVPATPSEAPLQIATSPLPNAQVGIYFQASLTATGGVQPYVWSVTSGTLPPGISLDAASGMLSGTPSQGGKFDFSIQLSDSSSLKSQTAMKALTLSVLAFALQINSGGLQNGQVGVPFHGSISGSGGLTPYTWTITGALPSGLSMNSSSGTITGTPTQAGASTFTIKLTDSSQQTTQKSLSVTILAPGVQPLSIATTTLAQPTVGQAYSATLQATGGTPPYVWTLTSGQLPPGLTLNSSTGQLVGTPTSVGQDSITAQVHDSGAPAQTASKTLSVATSAAASLDQYGGDANHACAGTMENGNPITGATGFFYLYKDTNLKHWMYCDPVGNRFWLTGVQVVDYGGQNYQSIIQAKYGAFGSSTSWEAIQTKRLQAMGFNTVGEFSRTHLWYPQGHNPNPIPFIWFVSPAHYTLGMKDTFANLPPKWDTFGGYRGYRSIDLYDPVWQGLGTGVGGSLWECLNAAGISCPALDASPLLVSTTMDDVAYFAQIYTNQSTYAIAITAPYEQFENSSGFGRQQVFSSPTMYTKQQWSTWLCGTRYANLAALNAAWGSNYSTCGSSATTAAPETIGTGDGATTSFTYMFLHKPVDPASIGIRVGGVLQGGDTPWFNRNVCGKPSGGGCIQAATGNIKGGTVTYSTGAITVSFSAPPANGVAITATYQYGGWPKATSGGTGLLDEDGTSSWWPAGDPTSRTAFPDPPVGTIPTDMDVFLGMTVTRYVKPVHDWIKSNLPHHLVGSVDQAGAGYRNKVYSSIAANADVLLYANTVSHNYGLLFGTSAWQTPTVAQYNSSPLPVYVGVYSAAQPDSQYNGVPCPLNGVLCYPTQKAKGEFYQSQASYAFNSVTGADGYGFIVGIDYWQYTDNSGERGAYGLVSLKDNLYNGMESCGSSIKDSWGLTTIPESAAGCYGDFITPVKAANRIWLGP
jgi:Putative Ig domain/Abnormal spindle-like microcephaly-assoc'd, ASPM-SPD-2-Hydin